jgi:hypothetical protein
MIVYDLECNIGHRFEGWFSSARDFEQQQDSHLLTCPVCSNDTVKRLPSAAYVNTGAAEPAAQSQPPAQKKQQQYANLGPEIMAKMIEHIIQNTENVGDKFPEEVRKIYYQESPERHIRGTASRKEAEALLDEGIEVISLPSLLPHGGKIH